MMKHSIEISLVVDLKSKEQQIYNFFSNKEYKAQNFYFVEDKYRDILSLDNNTL
jgi:hypothetical protein